MQSQTTILTNSLGVTGTLDGAKTMTRLQFADGRAVLIPTAQLLPEKTISLGSDEGMALGDGAEDLDGITILLVEERLQVSRRVVPTATVKLHKTVEEFETALDEPLMIRTFGIERTIFNQPIENVPDIRVEGETTIYPLVEEQLILTKQLVLKEEVRVTRRTAEHRDTRTVTLRKERLSVEREIKS